MTAKIITPTKQPVITARVSGILAQITPKKPRKSLQRSLQTDRYGLEADGVLHLENGKYAILEFKLGANEIDKGAEHLLEIENLIKRNNEKEKQCPLRIPDIKIVITGTKYGYRRPDGVLVIPIGCLKN